MFYIHLIGVILPKLSRVLSISNFGAVLLFTQFSIFLIIKKIRKNDDGWRFSFYFENKPFSLSLFEGSPDIAALKEIFLDGEYRWDEIKEPKTILDLGAHTGNTAMYFHLKYPHATIYAVEASPHTYEQLFQNVRNVENIKPIFGAVSDTDGELTFYESESSLGSSTIARSAQDRKVLVPCFTLATIMQRIGLNTVDFIKVDIEGSEEKIFMKAAPNEFSETYIIEVHSDLMSEKFDFTKKYFSDFKTIERPLKNPDRFLLYAKR